MIGLSNCRIATKEFKFDIKAGEEFEATTKQAKVLVDTGMVKKVTKGDE